MVVDNRGHVERMIKDRMAHDIAYELLKKIDFSETIDSASGDHKFRLAFWTTTSGKEALAIDEIMKIIDIAREIKRK